MNVDDYRSVLHEDISIAAKAEKGDENEEFLIYAAGILANGEEFDDFIEKKNPRIS